MKRVVVFLADGFEECEGLIVVDLLRRAGIEVTTASVMGRTDVVSSHSVSIEADALAECVDYATADMLVLPGGIPGADYLKASPIVEEQCRLFAAEKAVAAICAAPSVLAAYGLLEGRKATVYPTFSGKMQGAVCTGTGVVRDGNIITGQALGSAIAFALEIIKYLTDEKTAQKVADAICLSA